jgi:hypothetical protein
MAHPHALALHLQSLAPAAGSAAPRKFSPFNCGGRNDNIAAAMERELT